ncbi:MAG: MATE family efflux transporter [Termitinemataceae bacterium]|nr:MAG: MATE family efflux transporter [Termitinemataceae bacterium]
MKGTSTEKTKGFGSTAKGSQTDFILKGNLWKVMVNLSWPAVVAMALYGLNSVLDLWFVGHFAGETAVAGVSVVYPITLISLAIGSMLGSGAGSVLSIALGAKDERKLERIPGNMNTLTLIISLLFTAFLLALSPSLVRLMGGADEVMPYAVNYLRVTAYGAVFWIYGLAANMIIRAEGRMKTAALIMGVGLGINALANYILMGPLAMGVAGAAWGTNIAMLVYTLLGLFYFGGGRASFKTNVFAFYADKDIISPVMKLGSPALIMQVMTIFQGAVVFNTLSSIGATADVAFFGVVYRVFSFLTTLMGGLMKALQPVCGINYGAGNYMRVIHAYFVYTVTAILLTVPFWLISMAAPRLVLALLLPGAAFSSAQIAYCRIYMAILPLISLLYMAMTLFPAIGKGAPAAVLGLARQGVLYIPMALLLPRFFGIGGIYYGSFAVDAILVAAALLLVKREFNAMRKLPGKN